MALIKNCKFFITHGGSSNLWDSQKMEIDTIIFPRLAKYGEHIDNHQLFLTKKFGETTSAKIAYSYSDIEKSLKENFTKRTDSNDYQNPVTQIKNELETLM